MAPLLSGCDGWRSWFQPLEPEIEIRRFDRVLDEFVAANSFSALQRMNTEYPRETKLLIEDVLAIGRVDDSRIEQKVRTYYLDSTMQVLFQEVHDQYKDIRDLSEEFTKAFRALKQADADFPVPRVYVQISGLNQSLVVGDSLLGISLDKYLGADYPLYKRFYHPYQMRTMCRERIVPEALTSYLRSIYPRPYNRTHTVLDRILHQGRMHWVVWKILNRKSLEEEIGFEADRAQWCKQHEAEIWKWVQEEKLFESAEVGISQMLLKPRQGTPALSKDAADQLGLWMGIHIVDGYMKRHKEVEINDLLHATDLQRIWLDSGYATPKK